MDNGIYSIPSYFPYAQGNKWTYTHKRGEEVSEVNYLIEGTESFNGVEVPKRVQLENTEEYFCTPVDPVYGISDYKHHIGLSIVGNHGILFRFRWQTQTRYVGIDPEVRPSSQGGI